MVECDPNWNIPVKKEHFRCVFLCRLVGFSHLIQLKRNQHSMMSTCSSQQIQTANIKQENAIRFDGISGLLAYDCRHACEHLSIFIVSTWQYFTFAFCFSMMIRWYMPLSIIYLFFLLNNQCDTCRALAPHVSLTLLWVNFGKNSLSALVKHSDAFAVFCVTKWDFVAELQQLIIKKLHALPEEICLGWFLKMKPFGIIASSS